MGCRQELMNVVNYSCHQLPTGKRNCRSSRSVHFLASLTYQVVTLQRAGHLFRINSGGSGSQSTWATQPRLRHYLHMTKWNMKTN